VKFEIRVLILGEVENVVINLPELKGQTIILRTVKESDIDDRLALGRHDEFEYMCGGNRTGETEYASREVMVGWHENQMKKECAWIIEFEGKCIGGVELHNISLGDHSATFAIGIFDVSKLSRGIGTEAAKLVLKYGFEELKLHRIDLKVLDYNKRGIRCYEKCGFKVDGILRENAFIEGEYYSDMVMSILENEYRDLYTK
jgi:ribosomal-protein-alanine N-acetyltransferase